MSKPILIALLVILLAGGGIAFAQTETLSGLLGLTVPPQIEEGEDKGQSFGEEVSEAAQELGQEMDLDEIIPDVAQEARDNEEANDENEEERSPVADAVLEVLGGDKSPGDEGFGENVSTQAQEDGKQLGKDVSDAAREANGSAGRGNNGR